VTSHILFLTKFIFLQAAITRTR